MSSPSTAARPRTMSCFLEDFQEWLGGPALPTGKNFTAQLLEFRRTANPGCEWIQYYVQDRKRSAPRLFLSTSWALWRWPLWWCDERSCKLSNWHTKRIRERSGNFFRTFACLWAQSHIKETFLHAACFSRVLFAKDIGFIDGELKYAAIQFRSVMKKRLPFSIGLVGNRGGSSWSFWRFCSCNVSGQRDSYIPWEAPAFVTTSGNGWMPSEDDRIRLEILSY